MKTALHAFLLVATLTAPAATAVVLNPRGAGQVLLYPYYTVNKQQQTLVSVTNTTSNGKALEVRFREGYNGREVLSFRLFLAAHDTWAAALFLLSDAGLSGSGAAVLVPDASCTQPDIAVVSPHLPNGLPYQPFLNYAYIGSASDTGPTSDARTREGYFEIIEMAELTGNTLTALTEVNGVPANCAALMQLPPPADIARPAGGLFGTEAIVDVAAGTFFAVNAYAIDGFANTSQFSQPEPDHPNLSDATASASGFVSAYIPVGGAYVQLDYPPSRAIDAISALLMADHVFADWDFTPSEGAQTDWVVTLPTKHFYVDPLVIGPAPSIAPFPTAFGDTQASAAGVPFHCALYDRNGKALLDTVFDPRPPCQADLPYETQVLTFSGTSSAVTPSSPVLGSGLESAVVLIPPQYAPGTTVGTATLNLAEAGYQLRASSNGYTLPGLPIIGFEAINYINSNVTPGVLANYSAAYPLHASASCSTTSGSSVAACTP